MTDRREAGGSSSRRPGLGITVAILLIGIAILLSAILEGDLPADIGAGGPWIRDLLHRQGHLAAIGLLYLEESGIPLPAPGDVFVMYVGARIPRGLAWWLTAWVGMIIAVVLGASNLYLISRLAGRRIVEWRLARLMHITPDRLQRAERWFARNGVMAIIFGRHIPGFRVPITVAAGVFRVRYPVFAASVAMSTAIWVGVFLTIGYLFGGRVEGFLSLHRASLWIVAAVTVVAVIAFLVRSRLRSWLSRLRS